jgi:uncharacterized protein
MIMKRQQNVIIERRSFLKSSLVAGLGLGLPKAFSASNADSEKSSGKPLQVAVVTGGHPYDVPNFHKLFRSFPGTESYIQNMEEFSSSPASIRDAYDVIVFYHMIIPGPPDGPMKSCLERLENTGQGLLALHHSILAFPQWGSWSELVGIPTRTFGFYAGQTLQVQIANPSHPITRGLKPWDMTDETYTMTDASAGSEILLTVDHPKSMKTLGWVRAFGKSRVFCFQSGHDNITWANPGFREVLRRGISWCGKQTAPN